MNRCFTFVKTLCFILLLFTGISATSQDVKPGLLWRISGKGLQQSSYLFGTVHLMDKRVFSFGDSLYYALENTSGYAMEIDPDSLMVYYLSKKNAEEISPYLKDVISKEKFSAAKKKLEREFRKPAEKITVKELRGYYNEWLFMPNKANKMQTFMDAYLYNVMRKQGKWVGGIEDVQDQISVLEKYQNNEETANNYLTDFMNDSKQSKKLLEQMIDKYVAGDLEGIRQMSEHGNEFVKEFVLVHRNVKMAARIDSLANTRNTFFAIGCAHLPGDSGVINLLRKIGYTVTPVVSSQNIDISKYTFKERKLPWVKVTSSTGLYTVEMPGQPQNNFTDDESVDYKVYGDLGTNFYYFTMGMIGKSVNNLDSLLRGVVSNYDKKAVISGITKIRQDSIDGIEGLAKGEKLMYKIRVFSKGDAIYLAMVGTLSSGNILHDDVERFFNSFSMHQPPGGIARKLNNLMIPALGFSIDFPVRSSMRNAPEADTNWRTNQYVGSDVRNDVFYQVIVKDVEKGFYQQADEGALQSYKDELAKDYTVLSYRDTMFRGYKGISSEFIVKANGIEYYNTVHNLYRGNRAYFVSATTSKKNENRRAIDSFMNSFRLIDLRSPKWIYQSSEESGVKTLTTSAIEPYITREKDTVTNYWVFYDSLAPISFFIKKEGFSKYYWAKDDTSVLRKVINDLVGNADSFDNYRVVSNGVNKAVDATSRLFGTSNVKRLRAVLAGDTVYSIFAVGPKEVLERPDYSRVYEEFRVIHDAATSHLFANKRDALFKALHSTDSATFAKADEAIDQVQFYAEDLPYLHRALLDAYPDSAEYFGVADKLFERVVGIADHSTYEFIRKEYPRLNKSQEKLKYEMLYLLAVDKTDSNYILIKELLTLGLPKQGSPYRFFSSLHTPLARAKIFFPMLLKHVDDSLASTSIMRLTKSLIDSGMLDKKILLDNKDHLFYYAGKFVTHLQANKKFVDEYEVSLLIDLFQLMNHPEANGWLRKLMSQKEIHVKYDAAIALMENHQQVDPSVVLQLAASRETRSGLYQYFKKQDKLSQFPKQYYDQQHLGEAELYELAKGEDEEYEVTSMKLLGEKIITYLGVKRKFYLYKIDQKSEDEKSSHLGISGPFALEPGKLETTSYATGLVYDEEFDAARVNEQFKNYIKTQEQSEKQAESSREKF